MTVTLEQILDELYFSATSEADKGSKFERLMAAYLRTDPQYAEQFSDVWPWQEWPDRGGMADHGIDLVARERDTSGVVAIQCKFYDPRNALQKPDIDSFLSASGKYPFRRRIIVSTTDKWGSNAEAAIHGQQIPVQRIRFKDLADSAIDWSQFSLATPEVLALRDKKQLRQHQRSAIDDVVAGFATSDRGKLIMACGTGKTFTALRLAEQVAGPGGSVLFLVPSIALLSQAMREWTSEVEVDLVAFGVCSDPKVSKASAADAGEDISSVDLPLPATTDPALLHHRLTTTAPGRMRVVFATYQSIDVVARAQGMGGLDPFDLIVCDEAHRTTGVTLVGADESAFVRVHDPAYLLADRRLYMTATPRIYDDNSHAKALQANAVLASMDDETTYGPEFHRLGFGKAVSQGLLTDYKVLVLGVSEDAISRTFQSHLADEHRHLRLDDVAKMVGCWNGLAKRGESGFGFGDDVAPMTRAVAFANTIAASKKFTAEFARITEHYVRSHDDFDDDTTESDCGATGVLQCEVDHVDGSMNALARGAKLDWLRDPAGPDTCRVLSNARCLSEGVDVPALDAVLFLNPRKSQVDVVQSVGRVMRLSPQKKYGYIILPVGIPAGTPPELALGDSRFAVIWEVLQALRAHDERFDAMINQIDLNKNPGERLEVIFTDFATDSDEPGGAGPGGEGYYQDALDLPAVGEWRDAIYARIVAKVGTRRYWETWADDIRQIAQAHITRIKGILANPTPDLVEQFDAFLAGLRGNLNDSITRDQAIEMLSQHLITKPVFDALFEGYDFAGHNPVSQVMQGMINVLDDANLTSETESLAEFYESVRVRAAGIDNAAGKQRIITDLYESFFTKAFPKTAASLGVVYTPVQIVDFIIRSVDHLLATEFGVSISDEGVHVLDPFTGTGTFIVRLLESGLIRPEDLLRKYTTELHANEILLLAYYIAAINIEATLHGLLKETDPGVGYTPFNGIVLTDTFQMTEHGDVLDTTIFPTNNARADHQLGLDIRVIVANPPYSVGQDSANDANANLKYPSLDGRVEATYATRSGATLKNSLYDSYIRAIRWATDRIGDQGVIGYVTNGGWIDSNTADGLRKTLADEFAAIYAYNLRGNQRTAGELSRKEGGKVFGSGSRNTVAIVLLVKKQDHTGPATIHYRDIGDYFTRDDKLRTIDEAHLESIEWRTIIPNEHGDWINQRDEEFGTFKSIADRDTQSGIFRFFSGGLKTNRDAWVYSFSKVALELNVRRMLDSYNDEVERLSARADGSSLTGASNEGELKLDPRSISWSSGLLGHLAKLQKLHFERNSVTRAAYRPFTAMHVYFNPDLNDRTGRLALFFPDLHIENLGFFCPNPGSSAPPFMCLASDSLPDLGAAGISAVNYYPRWVYQTTDSSDGGFDLSPDGAAIIDGRQRVDNITDSALRDYRDAYGPRVTKDDVFFYVYGLLHSPDYRERYAADIRKMLPRIPRVTTRADFDAFLEAGRELATLHVAYESVEPYPLEEIVTGSGVEWELYRVSKMRFAGRGNTKDRSRILYNSHVTLAGIPDDAYRYTLGSRSAIEWVMDRYQVKTDKASGIVNDPNDWSKEVGNPRYIVDLLKRVTAVSVDTMRIVDALPPLRIRGESAAPLPVRATTGEPS